MERRITADLLRLDSSAILDSITDSARRDHARKVLDNCVQTLSDCESRRQISDLMEENIRILSKVQETMAQSPAQIPANGGSEPDDGNALAVLLDAVPQRVVYMVVAALVSAVFAAMTGSQIDWHQVTHPRDTEQGKEQEP